MASHVASIIAVHFKRLMATELTPFPSKITCLDIELAIPIMGPGYETVLSTYLSNSEHNVTPAFARLSNSLYIPDIHRLILRYGPVNGSKSQWLLSLERSLKPHFLPSIELPLSVDYFV
ncbi:hypothetical protein J6590_086271 [Homalodisca vitripennis]|nr:hypothetical protein J6590_086271 [Homalodisca vitripennis]